MNSVLKLATASAVLLASSIAVAADPVISLTSTNEVKSDRASLLSRNSAPASTSYKLDFIAGDHGAAVVQFDVVMTGKGSFDLSACGGTTVSGSDHLVYCKEISPERVRVLVDSPTNSVVPTATFGTITVRGASATIERGSVVVGDPQANAMSVEVL